MDEPQTKAEIMERTRAARAAFDALLARMPDERLIEPGTLGDWSVKDVMAHIAADQRWFAGQMDAALRGEPPTATTCYGDEEPPGPEFDMSTQDGRNAWQHSRVASLTLDEVRRNATEYAAAVLDIVERLPEAELDVSYTIADIGSPGQMRPARDGEWGVPLRDWVRGTTWHHYEDHAGDLRAFLGE